MSVKSDIRNAVAARLQTITAANGYTTDVKTVYYDTIPIGIDLAEHELPAIFLLDSDTTPETQLSTAVCLWNFNLQLWHNKVADSVMDDFVRDVYKAIFANSPTAQVIGSFRSLHSKVVEIKPLPIVTDLQMIEANRVYISSFGLHYRTQLYDM